MPNVQTAEQLKSYIKQAQKKIVLSELQQLFSTVPSRLLKGDVNQQETCPCAWHRIQNKKENFQNLKCFLCIIFMSMQDLNDLQILIFQIYILQSPNFHSNANLMGTNHLSLHLYPEPSSQMFSLNELCIPLCPLPLDCQVLSHCHSERRKLGNPRQRLAGWAAHSSHQPVHPPPWQPGP